MMKLISYILIILFPFGCCLAFDPPDCIDPWYYQSYDRGLTFMVPDKAQHYYGSYALTEALTSSLGERYGVIVAFSLGFLWEINDSKTSLKNGGVVGFSYKDLIADGLGVVSSVINKRKNIKIWVAYSTFNKDITIHTTITW